VSDIDKLWSLACSGDGQAFGDWAGRVERPVLLSLRIFARAIDTEGIVQETLLRMWQRSQADGPTLEGEHASLRFAVVMARNLALNMARKLRREHLVQPEHIPVDPQAVRTDPASDPLLRRIIEKCIEALSGAARKALEARLLRGHVPDAVLANSVDMTRNTFLQNITRGRRQLADCLRQNGAHEHEAFR